MPTRTAWTVRTIEHLADMRVQLHAHFMADSQISPDEHVILRIHEEISYAAERADYGKRALISLLNYGDPDATQRQDDEWRQLEQLRERVYGQASIPVAAG